MDCSLDALAPIAGVTLAAFVAVSLELARVQFDARRAPEIAADLGIATERWLLAARGWEERLRADDEVMAEFTRLYQRGWGAR